MLGALQLEFEVAEQRPVESCSRDGRTGRTHIEAPCRLLDRAVRQTMADDIQRFWPVDCVHYDADDHPERSLVELHVTRVLVDDRVLSTHKTTARRQNTKIVPKSQRHQSPK